MKISKWFKKHLTSDKNHKHLLKKKTVAIVFITVFVIEALFVLGVLNIIPISKFLATIYPGVLIDLTNTTRQEANLSILKPDTLLEKAAVLKAEDMAKKGYFAHTSPEGITPWYWFDEVGYPFIYAGENLAVNFSDSGILHNSWLESPSHKANIVNDRFSDIGIATAMGTYKGKEAVFVVQLFGRKGVPIEPIKETIPLQAVVAETSNVLGETIGDNDTRVIEEDNSYIAVKKEGLKEDTANPKEEMKYYSSFFSRISSAPAKIPGYLGAFFLGIMLTTIILQIVTKSDIKLPAIFINGMFIFVVVVSALVFNHWLIKFIGQVI